MKKALVVFVLIFAAFSLHAQSDSSNWESQEETEQYRDPYTFQDFLDHAELQFWIGSDQCAGVDSGFVGLDFGMGLNYDFHAPFYAGVAGGVLLSSQTGFDTNSSSSETVYGSDDEDLRTSGDDDGELSPEGFFVIQAGARLEFWNCAFRAFGEVGYFRGFPGAGLGLSFQYGNGFGFYGTYAVDWCPNNQLFVDRFIFGTSIHL